MSHTSRYVRSNGATVAFAFNKAKQYKMSSAGVITELADGVDAGDEELAIPGSKAHLRRLDW